MYGDCDEVKNHNYIMRTKFIILCLFVASGIFAQQNSCNDSTPGWGESLGTVSFQTTKEWTISNNGVHQISSDAVTATACNKADFDGGSFPNSNFNADCRSSPGHLGKLFSWCAIIRFKEMLCPAPWRIPTNQDFIDLDKALGGTGQRRHQRDVTVRDRYINDWGISFIGRCYSLGANACYWSQTEHGTRAAFSLYFNPNNNYEFGGWNMPGGTHSKNTGLALRCVRDY